MLAAALLSGGIQLLDFEAEGPGGRLVPTALLRGHCGIVRALRWLPPLAPQPQPPPPRQLAAPQEGQQAAASPGQGEAQQAAAGEGQAERQEEGAEQAQQAAQPPRMLLLSGSEDQSVRLYDIQRQLAAWQQRQEAAAAAAQAAAEAERASAERAAQATEGAARPVEASAAAASLLATVGQPQEQRAAAADQAGVEAGTAIKRPAVTAEAAAPAPAAPLPSTVAPPAPAAAQPSAAELPGASKKKAVASALGSRPLLPTVAVGDSARQQQEAQMGCLSLVNQLLPAAAAAGSGGDVGGSAAAPPPDPAAVALLGCAADPLTASLALQQAAASLAAGAGSATSSAGRQATAQRGAAVALFRGDVAAAVQLLLEHDALAADFVSLSAAAGGCRAMGRAGLWEDRPSAPRGLFFLLDMSAVESLNCSSPPCPFWRASCCPCAGPAAWRAVTLAWAAKLEQQLGEPHMAALHLLAVREEEEAVRVSGTAGSARRCRRLWSLILW